MNIYSNVINDPSLKPEERLKALGTLGDSHHDGDSHLLEINNHIHTIYSFSPYTPCMAALMAKKAGLGAAGSVDHDSIAAADEMIKACSILGIGGCVGFEVRVSFKKDEDGKISPFAERKINNPDSEGLVYMTVQGIPKNEISAAVDFLKPIREERLKRTKMMTVSANILLKEAGLDEIDFDQDIINQSKYTEGGGITERHLLSAAAKKIISKFGKRDITERLKTKMGITVPAKINSLLIDPENPHYLYDLLGVLKTEFLPSVFIQPDEKECIPAKTVTDFAQSISAVSAYAYLGDIAESPTGDKKAEKFEDDYIEELFSRLSHLGYHAVTYMPPRNTLSQLNNLRKLSAEFGFMEISGVDINSSRQSFNCPEVLKDEFRHLLDTTWALIAHERLSGIDKKYGLFSKNNPLNCESLFKRIEIYACFGKKLDLYHPDDSAAVIAAEIDKGRIV